MSVLEFDDCTPREFWNRLNGWRELRLEEERYRLKVHQERWEQARFLAYYSLVAHVDSKKKDLKITDIAKFPWEISAKEIPKISREEILEKLKKRGLKLSENLKNEANGA